MKNRLCLLALLGWTAIALHASAQFKDDAPPAAAQPGETAVQRWRVGMIITPEGSAFRGVVGATTIPMDWPEQKVREVERDLSPGVSVSYKDFDGIARQMVVKIPALGAQDEARAILTFEIKRTLAPPPSDTGRFALPDSKRPGKLAVFLAPSPHIESNHPDLKKLADQVTTKKAGAWSKVEAMYDWVRGNVEFKDNQGQGVMDVLETLNAGEGDCDEMCSAFIAMCRAFGVPARMVRVPGHVFAEFYLLDGESRGEWFPCQLAGTRGFGGIVDPRPILQKGDNVVAADPNTRRKTRVRFVPDSLVGMPAVQGGQLKLKLVCEPVR